MLVGSLAAGVILASDVFHSGSEIETLLFGSLLLIDAKDVAMAAVVAVAALLATTVAGDRWLAAGFDTVSARSLGVHSSYLEALLLVLVAATAIASLFAVGRFWSAPSSSSPRRPPECSAAG